MQQSDKILKVLSNEMLPEVIDRKKLLIDEPTIINALDFASQWLRGQQTFSFTTSGSTGVPKSMVHERNLMSLSANNTLAALGLKDGNTALLCMDAKFIGGAMMIVRALVGHMHLIIVPPSRSPVTPKTPQFDFSAMVPLQLKQLLVENDPSVISKLNDAKALLLGGGPADESLIDLVQKLKCSVFATFGMTETVSHVALRPLNGPESSPYYTAVGDVVFSTNSLGNLCMKGSITNHELYTTNDMVDLINDRTFKWIGRTDFIINSGGIKVNPEEIESAIGNQLRAIMGEMNYLVLGIPDDQFGEVVTLVIEWSLHSAPYNDILERLKTNCPSISAYKFPKRLVVLPTFPLSASGKPDRKAIKAILNSKNQ